MAVTGEPSGPPGKCGVSVIDFAGAYASALALMVGLWDASRSGTGRDLDVSLLDTAVSMLSYFATWTLNRDWEPARVADSGHQTLVPSQNFRTAAGWIVVFCAKEKFREALAEALDQGHLREVASPIRTEGTVQRPAPAPRLGQHTDEMLAGLLGYPPAKIAALRASGALGGATAPSAPSAT